MLVILTILLVFPLLAFAEADGPDHWQVKGVEAGDVLNMRVSPFWSAEKVGEIPPGSQCVKNLGCQGGLTFEEFTTLSDEEKQQVLKERPRWCMVEYDGVVGWVNGRYLREGSCE